VADHRAIRVTAVGETRSKERSLLLSMMGGAQAGGCCGGGEKSGGCGCSGQQESSGLLQIDLSKNA
jgi:hypothetical protein